MKKWIARSMALLVCCAMLTGCGGSNDLGNTVSDALDVSDKTKTEQTAGSGTDTSGSAEVESVSEDAEYVPGTCTDTEYTSETLGLKYTASDKIVLASQDELNEMAQDDSEDFADDDTSVYEMMASDVSGNNVFIMADELPLAAMTEELYMEALQEQMKEEDDVQDVGEISETTICGTAYPSITYTITDSDMTINQTLIAKKFGKIMYTIAVSYETDEDMTNLLSGFSKL